MDVCTYFFWLSLLFLTASFLLPYLAGPFLIHRRVKMQADPELVPFPPDHPSLPADVADHFRTVIPRLEGVGFETVAGLALPRQTTNVQGMVLVFVNRETKDVAIASVMYGEFKEGPKLQTAYVEIATRFRDGTAAFPRRAWERDFVGFFGQIDFVGGVKNTRLGNENGKGDGYQSFRFVAEGRIRFSPLAGTLAPSPEFLPDNGCGGRARPLDYFPHPTSTIHHYDRRSLHDAAD